MHLSGVNVRFMGYLRQCVTTPHLRTLILVEMLARAARDLLYSKLRAVVKRVCFLLSPCALLIAFGSSLQIWKTITSV